MIFSLIAILSFGGAAGPTGAVILSSLTFVFGWMGYVVPFGISVLGLHLLVPQYVMIERLRVIGLLLGLLGVLGLSHLLAVSLDDSLQAAYDGSAGGYVGFLLSYPVAQALGRAASVLIYAGVFIIGLILTFRLSPGDVSEMISGWLQARAEAKGEDEAEQEAAEEIVAEEAGISLPHFQVNPVAAQSEVAGGASNKKDVPARPARRVRMYRPPILKLLQPSRGGSGRDKDLEKRNKETIRKTLEHFGITVEMGEANSGPTVTQYTLRPEQGTKLSRITALQNDMALSLAAHPIRIEAPIPNKDLVGIEIPNKQPALVRLRDLLVSPEYRNAESPLTFPLGKDVTGRTVVDRLERLPHLLIAGSTGAGKSVNIHTLLISWLYRNSPDTFRLILVDPKRVELAPYNGIPHLLAPVIVDAERTMNALHWALEEMDVRYRLLEESGARNLASYNSQHPETPKPFIVIVIDELADLMVKHAREVEAPIVRLSQMARAVGIHLVLATQRPSVNVITGLIKANVSARIAFSVASQVDSRTILDQSGAEKLVGNGDMLYLAGDKARPIRIQGGFVSEEEVRKVVEAVKQTGAPEYNEAVTAAMGGGGTGGSEGSGASEDALFEEAKQVVVKDGKASASLLQRRLRIGYARAARILDMLEERGVIGTAVGNKPRSILMDPEARQDVPVREEGELDYSMNDGGEEEDAW